MGLKTNEELGQRESVAPKAETNGKKSINVEMLDEEKSIKINKVNDQDFDTA